MPKGIPKNKINKGWFKKGQIPHNKSGKFKNCLNCGKKIWVEPKQNRKYCSKKCFWSSLRGRIIKNSGQFKKGHIPWHKGKRLSDISLRKHIQNLQEYKNWRKTIYERDDYTCQICYQRGGRIHAHHKKQFKQIIKEYDIKTVEEAVKCKELWNIDNGVAICEKCHEFFKPSIVWIYGQSNSGKTTFAKQLQNLSYRVINLDGDEMRWSISSDLGFSKKDRIENNLRIAKLAMILKRQGFNIAISTILPYKKLRKQVKEITNCKFIYLDGGKKPSKEHPFEIGGWSDR